MTGRNGVTGHNGVPKELLEVEVKCMLMLECCFLEEGKEQMDGRDA